MNTHTSDVYRKARQEGRHAQADHPEGMPVLEELLPSGTAEIPLGTLEIPIKKIRGTYARGRAAALAFNFMPLLAEDSEFAHKWVNLCEAHLKDGIRDPIKAYEYLGYYYVMEGHKRVSVLAAFGAYSLRAEVIRLLPPLDENNAEIAAFYDFIRHNRRAIVGHMWFSRPGELPRLLAMEGDLDASFFSFRQAYHAAGYTTLPITTGDAFYEYARIYGLPDESHELKPRLKSMAPVFRRRAGQETSPRRPREPVTVVLENPGWLAAHESALWRLQRTSGPLAIRIQVEPNHADRTAMRLWLEGEHVLLCAAHSEFALMPAFDGQPRRAAFLAGVAAGSLTETNRLGVAVGDESDAQAFAYGASMVNAHARTSFGVADMGDIDVWLGGVDEGCPRGFPGVYAWLRGRQGRFFAALAWDWLPYYQVLGPAPVCGVYPRALELPPQTVTLLNLARMWDLDALPAPWPGLYEPVCCK